MLPCFFHLLPGCSCGSKHLLLPQILTKIILSMHFCAMFVMRSATQPKTSVAALLWKYNLHYHSVYFHCVKNVVQTLPLEFMHESGKVCPYDTSCEGREMVYFHTNDMVIEMVHVFIYHALHPHGYIMN